MNTRQSALHQNPSTSGTSINQEALQARFALRVTSRLTDQSAALPQDITERLRVAREQALLRARAARVQAAPAAATASFGSVLAWFGNDSDANGWWVKLGSVLPLIALVAGLMLIQDWHGNNQIASAAEVDASLLADDLPPSAYSDNGFIEFLRSPQD